MKVKEFIAMLSELDQELEVVGSIDDEGNGYGSIGDDMGFSLMLNERTDEEVQAVVIYVSYPHWEPLFNEGGEDNEE